MENITTKVKIFYDRINSSKQRSLFVTAFIVLTLPVLIYTLLQVQNLVQHANPNGTVALVVDGGQVTNGGIVTKTFVKLKVTQPDGWQIAAVPSQKQYSFIKQANAQEAPCPKAGDPGTTDTYGTTTYDKCVDNAGGRSDANTLCSNQSATRFRCYFSGNSYCISGSDESDFNYYCPSKPAAPTATTAPVAATLVPCPQAGQPGANTVNFGTTTYDTCVDDRGGVNDATFHSLCTDSAATKFRCFYSKNPTYCISGTTSADLNYYCPAKSAAPNPTSGSGGSGATCISINTPTSTIRAGDSLLVSPNFTGHPASIKFFIGTNDIGVGHDFRFQKTVQNPISGEAVALTDTQGIREGTREVEMMLYDSQNNVLDTTSNSACTGRFRISGSTVSPTTTSNAPSQVQPSPTPNRAIVNASPTPVIPQLQKIIIENIDAGSQGSPREEFDRANDGRAVIAQLLAGTFDWQLNPYATDTKRKVRVTFVDSTGQNRVTIDTEVILKASVQILNTDNGIPQNNRVSNARVKLVINGTALLTKQDNFLVKKAYAAQECTPNNKEYKCDANWNASCVNGGYSLNNVGGAIYRTCTQNGTWGNWDGLDCRSECKVVPTATPLPPTQTPLKCIDYNRTTHSPGDVIYFCSGMCLGGKAEAIKYTCSNTGSSWDVSSSTDCISPSDCNNNFTPTAPTQTPKPSSGRAPGEGAPAPVGGGSSVCPQSGDTCSYSEANGQCQSGHGATGFNVPGCQYSCGPIACPSGGNGGSNPTLPPVEPPANPTGGGQQGGAQGRPTITIRNADGGSGGSGEREVSFTTGDITIDNWNLNTTSTNSLRTVQAIFKNANGDTVSVVNAFVNL